MYLFLTQLCVGFRHRPTHTSPELAPSDRPQPHHTHCSRPTHCHPTPSLVLAVGRRGRGPRRRGPLSGSPLLRTARLLLLVSSKRGPLIESSNLLVWPTPGCIFRIFPREYKSTFQSFLCCVLNGPPFPPRRLPQPPPFLWREDSDFRASETPLPKEGQKGSDEAGAPDQRPGPGGPDPRGRRPSR